MDRSILEEAEKIVKEIGIPGRPQTLIDINIELKKPYPDFDTLSRYIEKDIHLIVTILKLVNSPFFGLRHKIDSAKRALTLLGLNNFNNIILASCMHHAFKGNYVSERKFEQFYTHSLLVADVSRFLSQNILTKTKEHIDPYLAYMVGVFHDCGVLIMSKKFPDYYEKMNRELSPEDSIIEI